MRITTVVAATAVATTLAAASVGLGGAADAAPASHVTTARADWTKGAHSDAAKQGHYWNAARHQLAADGSRYVHERSDLDALTAIPLTSTTAAQRATATRVTRELNGFFDTPGLYGISVGDAKTVARTDWINSARVAAASQNKWFAAAKDELGNFGTRYSAERKDLTSLEAIPLTGTTAAQRATAHHDVHKLNLFFHTPGLND